LCFCFIFFSVGFHIMGHFLLMPIFILNSFMSLFMVSSMSLWCLFRAPVVSFICSCAFSYSLLLLSQDFSCTFWLTMSSNIFMKFSVITWRISSFRVFLWTLLGSLG
jgi:hypothetical protein